MPELFEFWDEIESDLQDLGVDIGDAEVLATRTWPWLRTRILGLVTRPQLPYGGWPNRLQTALAAKHPDAFRR